MTGEQIVIHYGPGELSVSTVEQVATDTGQTPDQVRAGLRQAVDAGFLTPRPDGSYDATLPAGLDSEVEEADP